MTKTIVLNLDSADYDRLEAEAKRLGIPPGALAGDYIHSCLEGSDEVVAQEKWRMAREALDRLAELTAGLPSVDAVEVAREARDELERRPFLR